MSTNISCKLGQGLCILESMNLVPTKMSSIFEKCESLRTRK